MGWQLGLGVWSKWCIVLQTDFYNVRNITVTNFLKVVIENPSSTADQNNNFFVIRAAFFVYYYYLLLFF